MDDASTLAHFVSKPVRDDYTLMLSADVSLHRQQTRVKYEVRTIKYSIGIEIEKFEVLM